MDKAAYSANSVIGKFVISDPCYVLPDDIYYDVWENVYNFEIATIEVDESSFAVIQVPEFNIDPADTMNNKRYTVDSGSFGVIPLELCDTEKVKSERCKVFRGNVATITQDLDQETITIQIDNNVVEQFCYSFDNDDYDDKDFYDENDNYPY